MPQKPSTEQPEEAKSVPTPIPPDDSEAVPEEPGSEELLEMDPCAWAPFEDETMLDRTRRELYEAVCSAGRWVDGFFGEKSYIESAARTNGRVGVTMVGNERGDFDAKLRFRVQMTLPNLENRVNVFLGRENEDEFLTEETRVFRLIPDFFRNERDQDWLLGVGYSPVAGASRGFDVDVGLKVRFPLEPYVRGRYRHFWLVGDKHLVRFNESVYWRNQRGFGTSGAIDVERTYGETHLLRFESRAVIEEASDGVRWRTGITLFQMQGKDRAVAYLVGVDGETDDNVPVKEWGFRVTVRQRMFRPWFYGEVQAGVAWLREPDDSPRDAVPFLGIGFELEFARKGRQALLASDD